MLGGPTCFGLCGPHDVEVLVFGNCTVLLHRNRLLLLSFPRAVCGYLLSPLSFARLHTLFVWSLVLFPQSFCSLHLLRVDGTLLFWSLCACSPVRSTSAATLQCTTHVVRPCFRVLQADVCTSFTSIVFRGRVLPWRKLGCTGQSPLGCFAS